MKASSKILFCGFLTALAHWTSKYPVYLRAETQKSPNTIVHGPSKSFDYYISCSNGCTRLPHADWVGIGFCDSHCAQRRISCVSSSPGRGHLPHPGFIVVFKCHSLSRLVALATGPDSLLLFMGGWFYGRGAKLPYHYPLLWSLLPELVQHQPLVRRVFR